MTALEAAIREFLALLLAGTGAEAEVTIHVTVRAGKGNNAQQGGSK